MDRLIEKIYIGLWCVFFLVGCGAVATEEEATDVIQVSEVIEEVGESTEVEIVQGYLYGPDITGYRPFRGTICVYTSHTASDDDNLVLHFESEDAYFELLKYEGYEVILEVTRTSNGRYFDEGKYKVIDILK